MEAIAPRATGRECIGVYKYTSSPSVRPGRCLADFPRPPLPLLSVGFRPLPQRCSGQVREIVVWRTNLAARRADRGRSAPLLPFFIPSVHTTPFRFFARDLAV